MRHRISIHSIIVRSLRLGAVGLPGLAVGALIGCQTPPRADLDAAQQIADATGLEHAVVFRIVGPDGGPIDEPDAAGAMLPLSEAVRRAVTTDPGLQAAMARIRIALADADQARLLPNPILNVVVRWGPGEPQIEASLAQDFIAALQIGRRTGAADNRLRQAAADAVTVALDLARDVQERYAAVRANGAVTEILSRRLALVEKLSATARDRLDAGEGTSGDLATIDAQRIGLMVEIDQVMLAEREDRLQLARLIGEPSSSALWTLEAWAPPVVPVREQAAWIAAALDRRPEVQAIVWRLRALGDDESIAGSSPWEGTEAGVDAQRDGDWTIGPSVSTPVPIFDMGQARKARVIAEQLEARHELTQARRAIVQEVRLAYEALAACMTNIARIRGELIPIQERRRQLAEDAYAAGLADINALTLAEGDLLEAHSQGIEVEREAWVALVNLERAVGGAGAFAALMQEATVTQRPDRASGSASASTISSRNQ
ncbi:MAG: TolC family protein [Phycisphaerales bacterium]|nr:TolC family protein [Phycisphaerales bacterium]